MNKSTGNIDLYNRGGKLKSSLSIKLLIFMLLLTGIPAWFPVFYSVLGSYSMGLLHLHITLGIVLIVTGVLIIITQRKKEDFSLKGLVWPTPEAPAEFSGSPFIRNAIVFSLLLLIITGPGLIFGGIIPRKLLQVLIYGHGTGSLLLIFLIVITGVRFVTHKTKVSEQSEPYGEWFHHVTPGLFNLTIAYTDDQRKSERFLESFGKVLKYSRIKIFLDDYTKRVTCKDIFADKAISTGSIDDFCRKYSSADCLISVYYRYFTLSGWLMGWFSSGRGLTDNHVDCMSSLFFGYTPCSNCGDFGREGESHALFAKYGRFIIGDLGFEPVLSNADMPDDGTAISVIETNGIGQYFKKELKKVASKEIAISVNKPDSDIVLFPAVHDYTRQSDTFLGLMVALDALKENWTIGMTFFDGVNYGSFFGDWFIDRIMEKLQAKADELGAEKIILGGCSGISLVNKSGRVTTGNDFILNVLTERKLTLKTQLSGQVIGYANFCARGCYLNEEQSTVEIISALGSDVVEIGVAGTGVQKSDQELVKDITGNNVTILVTPYHNTRERFRFLVKKHDLQVEVCGLYELLAKIITGSGE